MRDARCMRPSSVAVLHACRQCMHAGFTSHISHRCCFCCAKLAIDHTISRTNGNAATQQHNSSPRLIASRFSSVGTNCCNSGHHSPNDRSRRQSPARENINKVSPCYHAPLCVCRRCVLPRCCLLIWTFIPSALQPARCLHQ